MQEVGNWLVDRTDALWGVFVKRKVWPVAFWPISGAVRKSWRSGRCLLANFSDIGEDDDGLEGCGEEGSNWDRLPKPLVEKIFGIVMEDEPGWTGRKAIFAASGVCALWRSAAQDWLLKDLWCSSPTIAHPAQLFSLTPRPVDGGLVKCYVQRKDLLGGLGRPQFCFTLHLGSDHTRGSGKFLLSAVQNSWHCLNFYFSKSGGTQPCAKLESSILGTHHKLIRMKGSNFRDACNSVGICLPDIECLGSVKYKLRMKGMMRPRRLNVLLPHPSVDARTPTSCSPHGRAGRRNRSLDWRDLHWPVPNGGSSEISLQNREELEEKGHPLHRCESLRSLPTLKLVNKPPHWNDGLKCWCLNFRSRVKLASVKNFQLMCSNDTTGRIVMQFGKVDANTFIMDFNPMMVTAVQAFAIALTSFEGRLLL